MLFRIDPAAHTIQTPDGIPIPSTGGRWSFGGDAAWTISHGEVLRVDPASGDITSVAPAPTGWGYPGMIYANGRLWSSDDCGADTACPNGASVWSLDPATGDVRIEVVGPVPPVERSSGRQIELGRHLVMLAADDQAVWLMAVDKTYRVGRVIRFDIASGATSFSRSCPMPTQRRSKGAICG